MILRHGSPVNQAVHPLGSVNWWQLVASGGLLVNIVKSTTSSVMRSQGCLLVALSHMRRSWAPPVALQGVEMDFDFLTNFGEIK